MKSNSKIWYKVHPSIGSPLQGRMGLEPIPADTFNSNFSPIWKTRTSTSTLFCPLLYIYITAFQASPCAGSFAVLARRYGTSANHFQSKVSLWEATAENLPRKSLDRFQKQTKDEDKRPDRRAALVNTRDKSWRSSSLRDERRLENHS